MLKDFARIVCRLGFQPNKDQQGINRTQNFLEIKQLPTICDLALLGILA